MSQRSPGSALTRVGIVGELFSFLRRQNEYSAKSYKPRGRQKMG